MVKNSILVENIDSISVARGLRYFSTQESKILNLTLESEEIL
jgi:hypothetical protein